MKQWKWLFIICSLTLLSGLGGCSGITRDKSKAHLNAMTDTERSMVKVEANLLGERITLFDEETSSEYEINLIKSSSYDPTKEALLFLVQGTQFYDNQLTALSEYLSSEAAQTLIAIINTGADQESAKAVNKDFVEKPIAYQNFLTGNLLVWICDNYKVTRSNICFTGFKSAGYFAAYLLYNSNPVSNYLIINPELNKRTDSLDISAREEAFFTEENTTLSSVIYLLRAGDDQKSLAFTKTDQWLSSLREHAYKELSVTDKILAGAGHNTSDCEALLRGICYFSKKEYSSREASCVAASKEMTASERDSITAGKLSKEHEFYEEVVTFDPASADYINELVLYDEEIGDRFVIHVSLPPNFEESKKYPLVLMTDGVWRLSDHPQLRRQMAAGELDEVILVSVGYPNGYNYRIIRERDLLRQPDLYLQFLVDNLIPYLYEHYPVDTLRTTLTGHSYGGYWSLYALYHSDTIGNDAFACYYIGSPSFQANTNQANASDFEDWYYERKQTLYCKVYITVGGDEEPPFIGLIESRLADIKKHTYDGLTLEYERIDGYDHNTVFKPSIRNALIRFYGSKY